MKSILLQAIFILSITGTMFSQIETFEGEGHGDTIFTVGGIDFTTTGDLMIEVITGFGCNRSDRFLGSGTGNGGSSGSFGSFKVANPGDIFTVSTSSPWCVFLSSNDGSNGATGDIKFTGTLSTMETIEETIRVVHNHGAFDTLLFSSEIWEEQVLIELEVSMVSDINYIALDNIAFENILTTSVSAIQEEEIKIYPNPAVREIEIIGIDDSDIKIMDAFGRIVRTQPLFNSKINISELPIGFYYISFNFLGQQITKQIIKL